MTTRNHLRKRIGTAVVGLALITATAACTSGSAESAGSADGVSADGASTAVVEAGDPSAATTDPVAFFDSSVVHDIRIEFDQEAYDAMIVTYETTGEKDWIEATITIDGTTIEEVGLRLKGNSSLFGLTTATAGDPEELPWLIRFDKFVDDQTYQGHGDLVIRSNSTETAMNEAVALELLGLTGLATEEAVATRFTVNDSDTELRLAVELPDDDIWFETNFGSDDDSALYKADSEGDYSYRGDDPDAYDDVFDQKIGDDDLEPLIDFLDVINNSDDATFAAELADRLDVEAFATYLAYQDLVGNADDIDGRGNNSYLYYDGEADRFTVVNWDLNLAFGTANVGGAGGGPGGFGGPGGRPGGGQVAGGPGDVGLPPDGGIPGDATNILVDRFLADDGFADLYDDAIVTLRAALYESGAAADIVATWVDVLSEQASGLVDTATIEAEAAAILSWVEAV